MTDATKDAPKQPGEPSRFNFAIFVPFALGGYLLFRGLTGTSTSLDFLNIGFGIAACFVGVVQVCVETVTVLKPWRTTVNMALFWFMALCLVILFGIDAARFFNRP